MESKEVITAKKIILHIANKYNAKVYNHHNREGNCLIVSNDIFSIAITVCDTDKKTVIKIEDFIVELEYRYNGYGTDIFNNMIDIAKRDNCTLGLWCKKDNEVAINFYMKLGFKHIATIDDYWLEY